MNSDFEKPQRQSITGIVLIFISSLVRIIRNFWFLVLYLVVQDYNPILLFYSLLGLGGLLILALAYSIRYYLNFSFHINLDKKEFILQKGVFATDVTTIPFDKIQKVNFNRNLLQRIFGVYSVQIDTAGSKENEVEIMALTKEKADKLAEELVELSGKLPIVGEEGDLPSEAKNNEVHATSEWQYRLGLKRLFKIGLTTNYLRGLALLFTFYFWLQEQFQMAEEVIEVPDLFDWEVASSFILIILLLLLGMTLTIAETFIKYYGLKLKKRRGGLQVEMGLRNNKKVSIKPRKVQLLQIITNPVQEKLDMYKIKFTLGSSQDDLEKNQINAPGMPAEIVAQVRSFLFSGEIQAGKFLFPHKILLYRRIFHSLIPLGISLLVLKFIRYELNLFLLVGLCVGFLLLISVYQFLYFKRLKLEISEEFLIKHSGVWTRKSEILELYKVQAFSLSQPLWYKSRRILNLTFHSAGGDVKFSSVNKEDILSFLDFSLYSIENNSKPWM